MDLANKHSNDTESLKILFSSLTLICKIFFSLNSQVIIDHHDQRHYPDQHHHDHHLILS